MDFALGRAEQHHERGRDACVGRLLTALPVRAQHRKERESGVLKCGTGAGEHLRD